MLQVLLAILVAFASPPAQEEGRNSAKDSKIEIDNAWVRVLRVKWGPHEKVSLHEHPASVVVYLTDYEQRIVRPGGNVQEVKRKAGDVSYVDAGKTEEQNLSDQLSDTVVVELKPGVPKESLWPLPLDPVRLDPQNVSVLFENDRVRVLRTIHPPHIKSPLHEHPRYVVVFLTDMHATMTLANGKQIDDSRKPGDVAWRDTLKHVTENNGDRTTSEIQIELK